MAPSLLGRDSSNQVQVIDAGVSRKHCSVSEVSSGVFEIADLDSHNGTFVNGTKVSRTDHPARRPDSYREQRICVPHRPG